MRYSSLNTLLHTGKQDTSATYKIRITLQAKNRRHAHGRQLA